MVRFMKGIIKKEKKNMENSSGKIKIDMKDISKMIYFMETEYMNGPIKKDTKANGNLVK